MEAKKGKDNDIQVSGKTEDKPSKADDPNEDTVTNSGLEQDRLMTDAHEEESENVKSTTEEKGDEDDMMIIDKPLTGGAFAETSEKATPGAHQKSSPKRSNSEIKDEEDEDEEPVKKRSRRRGPEDKPNQLAKTLGTGKPTEQTKAEGVDTKAVKVEPDSKASTTKLKTPAKAPIAPSSSKPQYSEEIDGRLAKSPESAKVADMMNESSMEKDVSEVEEEEAESDEEDEDKPDVAAKAREKVQSTLKSNGKDPYPDWPPGESVPYAALCTTFSLVELTTKRLVISAHCSLFLRQVLRLTPQDLLPTVQLMINKLAADYAGIELGIGESLIMKAIGETTGRSLQIIKADQNEIGDLGLVAAKSRSNQPTMFKPKPLTVRGVLEGLMNVAIIQGDGSQGRKIAGIKKLLSAADAAMAGKGNKGVDITKDKGGASEAKFIIRFLEGKLRLGLAEKTVLVALAHAMVIHETEKNGNKLPTSEQLAKGESILKTVYR